MSFLAFHYNKNLIYAIIYWILKIINRSLMYFGWNYFKIVKKDFINRYYYIVLVNISDLLSGFLVLYIHCSLKKRKIPKTDSQAFEIFIGKVETISGEKKKIHRSLNLICKMIFIIPLDFLSRAATFIFYQLNPDATNVVISDKAQKDWVLHIDIIARYIFSIFILKKKMFKHHKLAIFIISIGFIILIPTDVISIYYYSPQLDILLTYVYIGILSFRAFLFPLEDTIIKKMFMDDYIIPENFMFLRGIGECLLFMISTPLLYFFVWSNSSDNFEFNDNLVRLVEYFLYFIIFYKIIFIIKSNLLFFFSICIISCNI